jgi:anti-anti-sigma factor
MRTAQVQSPTPIPFDVQAVRVDQASCVLAVVGELDLATIVELQRAVDDQLARGRRFVDLDLARLSFCDATGLGALIKTRSRLATAAGALGLRGCSPRLLSLLEMTGLTAFLDASGLAFGSGQNARPAERSHRDAESAWTRP